MLIQRQSVRCPAPRAGVLSILTVIAVLSILGSACFTGCTPAQLAKAQAVQTKVRADIESPAGQAILADVTSTALNVGLNLAVGNDTGAAIAGIQGAASAIRNYEGLPSAPSGETIAQAAALGAGVGRTAQLLAPSIEAIVLNANKSAKAKGVALKADAITEAVARGLDAVAGAKIAPAVNLAGTPGEAP